VFGKAMGNLAAEAHSAAFSAYSLAGTKRLVDVGGGEGYLIAELLPYYPDMTAVLFDEPHVAGRAAQILEAAGVADRVEIESGNLFDSVPAGGDVYVLSSILFSYLDPEVRTILGNIRKVMDPAGRILILEPIIPEGDTPHPGKLLDVTQLALHRGGVRSEAEFTKLFAESGLRLAEVRQMWPTAPTDLIVAVAA
jgi:SAM-dependent methyltransferase